MQINYEIKAHVHLSRKRRTDEHLSYRHFASNRVACQYALRDILYNKRTYDLPLAFLETLKLWPRYINVSVQY